MKILRLSAGNRLAYYLPQLVARAENRKLTENSLRQIILHKSWLVRQHCELVVKDHTRFFLAYEFENKELSGIIEQYFKEHQPRYDMDVAGKGLTALTVSGEIINKLLKSAFAVFDLSPSRKPELNPGESSNLPNYNVVLKLGLAMAFGIPSIVLLKEGTFKISDLQGWQWIEYQEIKDIPEQLKKKFAGGAWNKFLRSFQ